MGNFQKAATNLLYEIPEKKLPRPLKMVVNSPRYVDDQVSYFDKYLLNTYKDFIK